MEGRVYGAVRVGIRDDRISDPKPLFRGGRRTLYSYERVPFSSCSLIIWRMMGPALPTYFPDQRKQRSDKSLDMGAVGAGKTM